MARKRIVSNKLIEGINEGLERRELKPDMTEVKLLNSIIKNAPVQVRQDLGVGYLTDKDGQYVRDKDGYRIVDNYFKGDPNDFSQVTHRLEEFEEHLPSMFTTFVQRIGPTIMQIMEHDNPFYEFIREEIPFGEYAVENYIAPQKPREFNPYSQADPFEYVESDAYQGIFRVNRKHYFMITREMYFTSRHFRSQQEFAAWGDLQVMAMFGSANLKRKYDVSQVVNVELRPRDIARPGEPPNVRRLPFTVIDLTRDDAVMRFQESVKEAIINISNSSWFQSQARLNKPARTDVSKLILITDARASSKINFSRANMFNPKYAALAEKNIQIDLFPEYELDEEIYGCRTITYLTSKDHTFVFPKGLSMVEGPVNPHTQTRNESVHDQYGVGASNWTPAHLWVIFPLEVFVAAPETIQAGEEGHISVTFRNESGGPVYTDRRVHLDGPFTDLQVLSDNPNITVDGGTITISGAIESSKGQTLLNDTIYEEKIDIYFNIPSDVTDLTRLHFWMDRPAYDTHANKIDRYIIVEGQGDSTMKVTMEAPKIIKGGTALSVTGTVENLGDGDYLNDRIYTITSSDPDAITIDAEKTNASKGEVVVDQDKKTVTTKGTIAQSDSELTTIVVNTQTRDTDYTVSSAINKLDGKSSGVFNTVTRVSKGLPNLVVNASGAPEAMGGSTAYFDVTVENTGDGAYSQARLMKISFPSGQNPVVDKTKSTVDIGKLAFPDNVTVTSTEPLAAGARETIRVAVSLVVPANDYDLTFTVEKPEGDSSGTFTATTKVTAGSVIINSSVTGDTTVVSGSPITYTATNSNTGNIAHQTPRVFTVTATGDKNVTIDEAKTTVDKGSVVVDQGKRTVTVAADLAGGGSEKITIAVNTVASDTDYTVTGTLTKPTSAATGTFTKETAVTKTGARTLSKKK